MLFTRSGSSNTVCGALAVVTVHFFGLWHAVGGDAFQNGIVVIQEAQKLPGNIARVCECAHAHCHNIFNSMFNADVSCVQARVFVSQCELQGTWF